MDRIKIALLKIPTVVHLIHIHGDMRTMFMSMKENDLSLTCVSMTHLVPTYEMRIIKSNKGGRYDLA